MSESILSSRTFSFARHNATWSAIPLWIAVVLLAPYFVGGYQLSVASTVGLNVLLAITLVLVTGYGGQFSLATAAFYGIGAYGTGILTVKFGWPALGALVASAVIAGLVALLLGRPVFRLRGHFLAMATLAFSQAVFLFLNNWTYVGGATGFGGIKPFGIGGLSFDTIPMQFILVWVVVGAVLWGSLRLGRGREGRALKAIRGHEAAAAACGINVTWSKTRIFALSAAIGSIAGSLYAHQLAYINPPPFAFATAINVLAIAVLGGLRSPWGAIIGAVLYEWLRQVIADVLPGLFGAGSVGAGQTLVLGILLVVILVVQPDGVHGMLRAGWRAIERKRHGGSDIASREAVDDRPLAPGGAYTALAEPAPDAPIVLESRDLSKHYGGVHAVSNVDLSLRQGEILAVIGPNGAGKTTLLNMLSGNISSTTGDIVVGGKVTGTVGQHELARHGVARTFQTPTLFADMTVHENVMVGAYTRGKAGMLQTAVPTLGTVREERQLSAEIDAILEATGFGELRDKQATELSLGQQKLLEVARAMAARPKILLLDEPGAGINRSEKLRLGTLLRELQRDGMSILLIEHDMEFVMGLADRIHVLNFGETLAIGSPKDIQNNNDVVAAYLGTSDKEDLDVNV